MKTLNKKILLASSLATFIVPFVANAEDKNLKTIVYLILDYMRLALYLFMSAAVVLFVFYVVKYFMKPGDGAQRAEAGQYVMYAVIGFFVILSFWGLVNILINTFQLDSRPNSWNEFQNIFPGGSSSGRSLKSGQGNNIVNWNGQFGLH